MAAKEGKMKLPAESQKVYFICNYSTYTIQVKDGFVYLKCNKNGKVSTQNLLSSFDVSINLLNVISVTCGPDDWRYDENGELTSRFFFKSKQFPCFAITINFFQKLKNHCRKLKTIKLQTRLEKDCVEWSKLLKQEVDENTKKRNCARPCNLLVIVNPYSGNKKANSVYNKVVSPLFKLAGIKETVVITQHKGHAKEYITAADLSSYDGIIAVGGDGTFSEVVSGVLIAEQQKKNIALSDGDKVFIRPINYAKASVKVGVIPMGTGNILSYTTQGINDPETAALQIICGEAHPLDICSVYDSQGNFASFSLMGISYGFICEVIRYSDNMRMFGSSKTILAFIRGILNLKSYAGEVFYLPSPLENPIDLTKETSRCRYPCQVCLCKRDVCSDESLLDAADSDKTSSNFGKKAGDITKTGGSRFPTAGPSGDSVFGTTTTPWKVCRGRFAMIASMNTAGMFEKAPNGASPSAHLADGTNDLVLLRSVDRTQFFSYLKAQLTGNHFDNPFVEAHRIAGMRFRALSDGELAAGTKQDPTASGEPYKPPPHDDVSEDSKHSCWTSDGEFLEGRVEEDRAVTMWVHRGLVEIFAKGLEESQ